MNSKITGTQFHNIVLMDLIDAVGEDALKTKESQAILRYFAEEVPYQFDKLTKEMEQHGI